MEFLLLLAFVPLLFLDVLDRGSEDDSPEEVRQEVLGTGLADMLEGTEAAEDIHAGGGNDMVVAAGGDDMVSLDDGNDAAAGGNGDDLLFGGSGDDVVSGGVGNDTIWLGDGDDEIADDEFFDGLDLPIQGDVQGDDQISGGDGDDGLWDREGSNTLTGDLGRDYVSAYDSSLAAEAADSLSGGWGKDFIGGDDGDTMSGGADDDEFYVGVSDPTARAVTVTDFDGANEVLYLGFAEDDGWGWVTADDLSMTTDPLSGDVSVLLGDQVVAVLISPVQFDLSNVVLPDHVQAA